MQSSQTSGYRKKNSEGEESIPITLAIVCVKAGIDYSVSSWTLSKGLGNSD